MLSCTQHIHPGSCIERQCCCAPAPLANTKDHSYDPQTDHRLLQRPRDYVESEEDILASLRYPRLPLCGGS